MNNQDSLSTKVGFARPPLLAPFKDGVLPRHESSVSQVLSLAWVPLSGPLQGESKTTLWWTGLCLVSLLNIWLWLAAARVELPETPYRSWQLLLSGIYVGVCAFRSAFPRVDLERLCLWDTPLSAIVIGRSVATLAEICFAVQCTLFFSKLSVLTGVTFLTTLSPWVVPIVVLAQFSCWYAVITLNHLGHALEEILWTLAVVLLAVGLASCLFYTHGVLRVAIAIGIIACSGAAYVMSCVDVPMYIVRWRHHRRAQAYPYLLLLEGLQDACARRHATYNWIVWRREVPWMTLYFSVGVWLSIGLTLVEALTP